MIDARAVSRYPLILEGKVREVREVDDAHLLIVASDRISAYDWIMPTPIPGKGAILTALPAIEVVDSRYADWTKVGVLSVIADQGAHGHWVRGRESEDWRGLDLAAHRVTLSVDGAVVREGAGRNVLDHPLNAVLWLANTLNATGQTLRAGEYISTGTAVDIYPAKPGETISADFGGLGKVELGITAG